MFKEEMMISISPKTQIQQYLISYHAIQKLFKKKHINSNKPKFPARILIS